MSRWTWRRGRRGEETRKETRENAGTTGAAAETTGGRMIGVGGDGRVRIEGAEEEMTGEGEEAEMMTEEEEGGMGRGTTGIGEETGTEIEETGIGDERGAPQEEVEVREVETWLQGFKVWLVLKGMEEDEWERGMEGEGWAMMEEEWEDPGWVMMVPEWVDLME